MANPEISTEGHLAGAQERLALVEEAAGRLEEAELALRGAVRAAKDAGWSYRAIAGVAGVSHEQVRRVCSGL